MQKLRIVYAGTPEFAVTCLDKIYKSEHELTAVLTQPDRPAGRGMAISQSAVKEYSISNKIKIYQPEEINEEFQKEISQLRPDILIVAAYGIILPQEFLELFPKKSFNIHASILPRWRGAAPIQRAILNGDEEVGVTIMEVVKSLDSGDMFKISKQKRDPLLTSGDYFKKFSNDGADLMMELIREISLGVSLVPIKQNENEVSYAKKIKKDEGNINWHLNSDEIINQVLALNPFPFSRCKFRDKFIKIYHAQRSNIKVKKNTSGSIHIENEDLYVACGDNFIKINKLQPINGKPISGKEFINNYQVKINDRFENGE